MHFSSPKKGKGSHQPVVRLAETLHDITTFELDKNGRSAPKCKAGKDDSESTFVDPKD